MLRLLREGLIYASVNKFLLHAEGFNIKAEIVHTLVHMGSLSQIRTKRAKATIPQLSIIGFPLLNFFGSYPVRFLLCHCFCGRGSDRTSRPSINYCLCVAFPALLCYRAHADVATFILFGGIIGFINKGNICRQQVKVVEQ